MTKEAQDLMRKALDWPSPHVRNQAARIGILLAALTNQNIPWRRYERRVLIGPNDEYLAHYQHPHRNPRQRGCILIRKRGSRINTADGAIAFTIDSEEDLAFFLLNPRRFLPLVP